ncbi:MAG: helix-turn-helix transcriptional regulator [Sphaerochaetaceae bacterium]
MRKQVVAICLQDQDTSFFKFRLSHLPCIEAELIPWDPHVIAERNEYELGLIRCSHPLQLFKEIPIACELFSFPLLVIVDDIRTQMLLLEGHDRLWYIDGSCDDDDLEEKILDICNGGMKLQQNQVSLTRREKEIYQLIYAGYTIQEIAYSLKISPSTVNAHKKKLFAKFKVHSATQMIAASADMMYQA